MHGADGEAGSSEESYHVLFREVTSVDDVCVNDILKIATLEGSN